MKLIYKKFNINVIEQSIFDNDYYQKIQMYDLLWRIKDSLIEWRIQEDSLIDIILEELDYMFYEPDLSTV
jgi:hypothetical protein